MEDLSHYKFKISTRFGISCYEILGNTDVIKVIKISFSVAVHILRVCNMKVNLVIFSFNKQLQFRFTGQTGCWVFLIKEN